MSDHISRRELKHDRIHDAIEQGAEAVYSHKQITLIFLLVVLAGVVAYGGWTIYNDRQTAAASLLVRSNRQRLRTVRAALDDMLKVEESGIWRNIVEADLRFHAAIVSAAGSVRLNRIFETLQAETRMCLNRLAPFYPDRRDVLSEHVEIFEALEAGASTQVVSLLRRHMRDSCQRLTQAEVHSKSVRSRRETVADSV